MTLQRRLLGGSFLGAVRAWSTGAVVPATEAGSTGHVGGGMSGPRVTLALEPRFMFDAAGAATGAEAAQDAAAEAEANSEPSGGDADQGDDVAGALDSHVAPGEREEVVIVDPSVAGYQDLLSGMDPNIEVIVLPANATLGDIASALDGRSGLDAVHLISHGGVGALSLGGETLSIDTLEANAEALQLIGASLADDGDIMLYGCDVGADGTGQAFIEAFAELTGADVAASDDATGAASLGGDWDMEASVGVIETDIAIAAPGQEAFNAVLATMDFSSGVTDNGNTVDVLVSGVTATFAQSGVNVDVVDGGGLAGSTGQVVFGNSSNVNAFTVSFSSAVDITSFHLGRVGGQNSEITVSVTDGSGNTNVVVSGTNYQNGSTVTLNWTGVTSFQIDHTSASDALNPLVDNIVFSTANSAPSLGGTPADDTATEDVATAIDLSAYNISDADGDTITITLAVDRGTIASTDGNGTTAGVTVANTGTASMTLQGSAANLNTYLNNTSKITYTTAANDTTTAVLTVTPNDGTVNGTADTVNISITPVNDDPTIATLPATVTVTEDTQSNIDLSATSFADVDSASITVTLTASAGTFAAPADGAGIGGGVTETLVNATTITLVGAPADINTYLDTATNIQYTAASNVNGNAAATITVTMNDGDGSGDVAAGTVNINVTAVNDNPTIATLPATVTVTEDTQGNIDLSAASFADIDSASITVTLTASAGTFAAPADGAGVGGGVTETLQSATVITLVGAPADINTYLDTASNIQYTGAANASGNAAATITVTMNDGDGSGNVAAGTVNVNITAVNDNPTIATLPATVTVTEDTQSNIALGAASFADVDSASITVTLTASAGTFAAPADGAGVGGGVTETLVSSTVITLVGAPADINTYLDTATNIQYTAASNTSGNAAATITVTMNDGNGSGDVAAGTVNINVTAVNDVPVFTGLDGTPTFLEGTGTGSILDANVTVADVELGSLNGGNGNFAGASLVLVRNGGANAVDSFSIATGGNLTVAGSNISAGGNVIASFDTASVAGQVTITFQNNGTIPTTALVNEVMQAVRYSNTSQDPTANVQVNWTFSDGNSGNAQGTGDNPGTATGSTTVTVTNVNDAPTLTATGGNPTFTEGGGAQDLFNTVAASTVEAADRITAMTMTVTNVNDGASEIISFDGSDVALTNGNSVTTATNTLSVSVSVTGTTATVSFTGATLTGAQLQTLVDGLTYRNSSEAPTSAGNRVVTVTGITDNGGTANSGADSAAPNIVSTVTVSAVNDQPTLTNFGPDAGNVAYTAGSTTFVAFDSGTAALAADLELDALNSGNGNYNGATVTLVRNGGANVTDRFGIAGGTTALDNGSTVTVGATNIGTVTAGSAATGTITITLNASATSALVDTFFQQIGYTNTNGGATGTVTIDVTLNDGNTGSQGSGGAQSVTGQVNVTIGNPPSLGGAPGDATINEDTTTAIDLSAYNVADADGDTITLTLAVAAGTIASTDGNGVTAGVTVANSGTASMTLQGTAANLNTYLNDATKVEYSPVANSTAATTLTVTPNDGSLTGTADTVAINITAVNDLPTMGGTPADANINEDTATAIDLSAYNVADVEGDTITLTLGVDAGTIATTDGNGTTANVTIANSGTGSMTLSGSAADLNTYLNDATKVVYTPAANATAAATLTVTPNDGTGNGVADTVTINIAAVNDNPTISGLPASIAATEDTIGNVDLSAASFADVDSASITVTLTASAGTFAAPADGAGVGGGVTESLVNATTITLVGAPADITTYLDTATNIRYTPVINASGNAAATITVTMNDGDGSGDVAAGTVNVNITAVNDLPTMGGAPPDALITEDTATAINLSAYAVADVDGDTITLTLAVDAGTIATTDGNGTTAGVTIANSGTTSMTLQGAVANLNAYLNDNTKVVYTPATNATAAATLTVTPNDGTGNGTADTVTININAVNDAATLSGVDNAVTFNPQGGTAVVLDSNMTFVDPELGAANGGNGDFNGATMTILRAGGANAADVFTVQNGANITVAGNNISAGGNVIATMNTGVAGQLIITFTNANGSTPTTALVNEVLQNATYATNAAVPDSPITINVTPNDGTVAGATQTLTASLFTPPPTGGDDDFVPPVPPAAPPSGGNTAPPPPSGGIGNGGPGLGGPQAPGDGAPTGPVAGGPGGGGQGGGIGGGETSVGDTINTNTPVGDAVNNAGGGPPGANGEGVDTAVRGSLGSASDIDNSGTPVRVANQQSDNGGGFARVGGGNGNGNGNANGPGGNQGQGIGGGFGGGGGLGGGGGFGAGGGIGGGLGGGFGGGPQQGLGSGNEGGQDDQQQIDQPLGENQSGEQGAFLDEGFFEDLMFASLNGGFVDQFATALEDYEPPRV